MVDFGEAVEDAYGPVAGVRKARGNVAREVRGEVLDVLSIVLQNAGARRPARVR